MPHGSGQCLMEWPHPFPRNADVSLWSPESAIPPLRRSKRMASFFRTSFDDPLAIDAAVLPLDKMVGIKDTCKLTLSDPNDSAGPAKPLGTQGFFCFGEMSQQ
eukprot:symbB.v1.2.033328.t1/scaffold4125.1/size44309/1